MSRIEATNKGVKLDKLPKIKLNILGATGGIIPNWKRLRVHLKTNETGKTHQEEKYITPEARDNLISYETLKKLGHKHKNTANGKELGNTETNTTQQKQATKQTHHYQRARSHGKKKVIKESTAPTL